MNNDLDKFSSPNAKERDATSRISSSDLFDLFDGELSNSSLKVTHEPKNDTYSFQLSGALSKDTVQKLKLDKSFSKTSLVSDRPKTWPSSINIRNFGKFALKNIVKLRSFVSVDANDIPVGKGNLNA